MLERRGVSFVGTWCYSETGWKIFDHKAVRLTKAWDPAGGKYAGGAAIAGETSEEAVKREILEETGLDVTNAEGGFLFSYHRENPGEGDNYFVDVYKYHMDFTEADIKLQTEETNAFQIADAAQLSEYDKQGIFLHYQSIKQALQ